jgi:hypothetical protein
VSDFLGYLTRISVYAYHPISLDDLLILNGFRH